MNFHGQFFKAYNETMDHRTESINEHQHEIFIVFESDTVIYKRTLKLIELFKN